MQTSRDLIVKEEEESSERKKRKEELEDSSSADIKKVSNFLNFVWVFLPSVQFCCASRCSVCFEFSLS